MDNKVHPHQVQIQPPVYSQTGQNVNAPGPSYLYQMQYGQAGQPMQTFQPLEGTSYPPAGQCPQPSMQVWAVQCPPEPGQTQAPCYTMSYPPAPPRPPHEQQQQQQQQQVVVFNNATSPTINVIEARSFCGQMTLACFVFWCCSPLFGLIAFILAAVASNMAVSDGKQAKQLGDASYGVSIAGIVVTVVIAAIVVGVTVGSVDSAHNTYQNGYDSSQSCSSGYQYNYVCYNYRTYYSSSSSCYYGTYDYSSGYCYYDTYHATTPACNYYYNYVCYNYRTYYSSSSSCYFGTYDYSSFYCYYNTYYATTPACNYYYNYSCYTYYTYTTSSSSCYSTYNGYPVYSSYGYYYCYYN